MKIYIFLLYETYVQFKHLILEQCWSLFVYVDYSDKEAELSQSCLNIINISVLYKVIIFI